ncbi:MAG TPA: HEAT repeat domain-containing protein [Kofleriaceae bacterium]|nr:HEAT repeat domain-containing protein [Kofleriaceae bacterium]
MRIVVVALVLTGAVAIATAVNDLGDAGNALTTIDMIPTRQQLDNAFAKEKLIPLATLIELATTDDTSRDGIAIRLRAIHALAKYCNPTPCTASDPVHQAVASVVPATQNAATGSSVLLLRAAVETLGIMRVSTDVNTLIPLLDHPSRDIRAATARALRDLCNTQAITPLRTRYSGELTDQVKLAISEALRILGQCSANP